MHLCTVALCRSTVHLWVIVLPFVTHAFKFVFVSFFFLFLQVQCLQVSFWVNSLWKKIDMVIVVVYLSDFLCLRVEITHDTLDIALNILASCVFCCCCSVHHKNKNKDFFLSPRLAPSWIQVVCSHQSVFQVCCKFHHKSKPQSFATTSQIVIPSQFAVGFLFLKSQPWESYQGNSRLCIHAEICI